MTSRRQVLIVEDNAINRELLCNILAEEYETLEAENGEEALAILRERKDEIALVLLDVIMPVMDGYQALKNIRDIEKEHGIPQDKAARIIMTTALNEEKNVKKAFELGCTVYCAKPIDMDKLRSTLQKLGLIK